MDNIKTDIAVFKKVIYASVQEVVATAVTSLSTLALDESTSSASAPGLDPRGTTSRWRHEVGLGAYEVLWLQQECYS